MLHSILVLSSEHWCFIPMSSLLIIIVRSMPIWWQNLHLIVDQNIWISLSLGHIVCVWGNCVICLPVGLYLQNSKLLKDLRFVEWRAIGSRMWLGNKVLHQVSCVKKEPTLQESSNCGKDLVGILFWVLLFGICDVPLFAQFLEVRLCEPGFDYRWYIFHSSVSHICTEWRLSYAHY